MTRHKRITLAAVAIVSALVLTFGIFMGLTFFKSRKDSPVRDTLNRGWGKEATVILLAGQSNAAGCSRDDYLQKNVSAEKYAEYKKGYDNVYINYFASGTNESHAFVKCSARQGEGAEPGFFGPELGLAEKLNELYPEKDFYIIKYAWGGTDLHTLWRAPSSGGEAGQLYSALVEYVRNSLEYLTSKGYRVRLEAMCWMQGESDSIELENAINYENNLKNFIGDLRTEFADYAPSDGIAFVDAYIAESYFWKYYKELNASKKAVADSTHMNIVIDTISHGLSITEEPEGTPDIAHYDSMSEIKLGHLFAEECARFF